MAEIRIHTSRKQIQILAVYIYHYLERIPAVEKLKLILPHHTVTLKDRNTQIKTYPLKANTKLNFIMKYLQWR